MLWRKIETELVDILRGEGLDLDTNDAADKIAIIEYVRDIDNLNITYIAKQLALRLEPAESKS